MSGAWCFPSGPRAATGPRPEVELMPANVSPAVSAVGFLTVVEPEGQGLFGGYLLLNVAGRPLEFYCTAPVRPNRAQEILYGPTLQPYLYGEQIGQTLLEKAKTKPALVFTDVAPALAVRPLVPYPVVYVPPIAACDVGDPPPPGVAGPGAGAVPGPPSAPRLHVFELGPRALAVPHTHAGDAAAVAQRWSAHAADFDLLEPFQRIRDAIDEARRSARQAA